MGSRSFAVLAALALFDAACADSVTDCVPGRAVVCPCPGGQVGAQACLASGNGFGMCVCPGNGTGSAGGSNNAGGASANGAGGAGIASSTTGIGGAGIASSASNTSASAVSSSTGAGGAITSSSAGGASASSASSASSTGATSSAGGGSTSITTGTGSFTTVSTSAGAGGGGGQSGGGILWGFVATSSGTITLAGVAVDTDGNEIIAGSFDGEINFGQGAVAAVGSPDIFVAKYDPNGSPIWAKTFGGGYANAFAVAVDPLGNVVIGGDFTGAIDFGSGTPMWSGPPGVRALIAKIDANGDYKWQTEYGGWDSDLNGGSAHVRSMAIDSTGDIAFVGNFVGPLYIGSAGIDSYGTPNLFVGAVDSSGTPKWATVSGIAYGPMAVAVDTLGDAVVAAQSNGPQFPTTGINDCMTSACVSLVKFDPTGTVIFSKAFGLSLSPDVQGIGVDGNDRITITGMLPSGTSIDFGGGFVTATRYPATYVANFDSGGGYLYSLGFGAHNPISGTPTATPTALACNTAGDCEVAGTFEGDTLDFGCESLIGSQSDANVYRARLDPSLACIASEATLTPSGSATINAVAIAPNSDTVAAGVYAGQVDFGPASFPSAPGGVFIVRSAR